MNDEQKNMQQPATDAAAAPVPASAPVENAAASTEAPVTTEEQQPAAEAQA